MGNLIHDRKQKPLPWESRKTVCLRCKGSKTVYYAAIRRGVARLRSCLELPVSKRSALAPPRSPSVWAERTAPVR